MKVLYLFNKVIRSTVEDTKNGIGHDSWLFGMLRLPKFGIETDFLEIDTYLSPWTARFLRKYILTMHYAHIPLFPLFFKYDIVFTSTAFGCLFLKALFRIKRFKWVILDFNILGTIEERKTFKQKVLAWSIEKGADAIVAISKAEADALKMQFPYLRHKIIFLYEATDTEFFKPQVLGKENIQEKQQIISVGNYARDFDTIIEAIKEIDIDLLIVGKFPQEKISSLPSYVKVVQLEHKDVVRAYKESKIAIVSLNTKDTYFDSVGTLAVGEALSMGKATLVTHTKSMESYIEDEDTGIFLERGNVRDMREVLVDLLQNEEKIKQLGLNAREFAVKKLNADIFAEKLALFLKNVV